MKRFVKLAIAFAMLSSALLAGQFTISLGDHGSGKTLQLEYTGTAENTLEIWRWTVATDWELVATWSHTVSNHPYLVIPFPIASTVTVYSPGVEHGKDVFWANFYNMPEGYYELAIGDGGGYSVVQPYGSWNGTSGTQGWKSWQPVSWWYKESHYTFTF